MPVLLFVAPVFRRKKYTPLARDACGFIQKPIVKSPERSRTVELAVNFPVLSVFAAAAPSLVEVVVKRKRGVPWTPLRVEVTVFVRSEALKWKSPCTEPADISTPEEAFAGDVV